MLNVLSLLARWEERWNSVADRVPRVQMHLGAVDRQKRSAWLAVDGDQVAGQLTVWESGECELEAYRASDGEVVLLEHRHLSNSDDLRDACETMVMVCGGSIA